MSPSSTPAASATDRVRTGSRTAIGGCRVAGSDHQVATPIATAALLERWLPDGGGAAVPEPQESAIPAPPARSGHAREVAPGASAAVGDDAGGPPLDAGTIAELRDVDDGAPFLQELFDTFLADAPLHLAALRAGFATGDAGAVGRAAHTLKSTSALLGAAALSDGCRALEVRARTGALEGCGALVSAVELEYERVRPWLRVEAWPDPERR